jgi:hypothetical protein
MLSAGIAITAIAPGASAAQGDPAAKAEIVAAFQRLNALPSYRMKGTNSRDGMTMVIEKVRPDKTRYTTHSPQGTFEIISVGKLGASRMTGQGETAGWRCTPEGNSFPTVTAFDIDNIRKDLDTSQVVRKPDTVIDGTPVRAYAAERIVDGARSTGAAYIGARNGLPRRLVDTHPSDNGPVTETIDFYDYGAKITIAMPACK